MSCNCKDIDDKTGEKILYESWHAIFTQQGGNRQAKLTHSRMLFCLFMDCGNGVEIKGGPRLEGFGRDIGLTAGKALVVIGYTFKGKCRSVERDFVIASVSNK